MRTFLKTVLVLVVAILAGACASKKSAQVAPTQVLDELEKIDPEGAALLRVEEARVRDLAVLRQQEKDLKTAQKAITKSDTPEIRKSRNDIKRAEKKQADILKDEAKAKSDSGLFCPVDGEIQKAYIHSSVAHGWGVHSNLSVKNSSTVPVHIIRKGGGTTGVVVQNLYPGCVVSLKQGRGGLVSDSGPITVWYQAVPSPGFSSGGQEFSDSPQITTYPCSGVGCQKEYPLYPTTWEIVFHR